MTVIKRDSSVTDFDLRRIVQAIEKAIGEDIPRQLRENHLETNNYVALMRGDFINDNLRNYALEEGVELLPFQRFGWKGRLIVDRKNRITLSVTTQNNLCAIPRKQRSRPHYTMSLLKMQNGELEGACVQETLYPMDPFPDEVLEADYQDIVAGVLEPDEGYLHYFVAYEADRDELVDIKLVLMDPYFNVVEERSLNHLIKPDFTRLTDSPAAEATAEQVHTEATRKLSKLKPGLRKLEEQA